MSIIQAMYSGSSALISFSEAMTVIGNNLANANTTAFKASSSSFEDVLVQTVGASGSGTQNQVGTGVGLSDIQQDMSQGSFLSTSNVTDLSINGKGFFMVKDPTLNTKLDTSGRPLDTFYTRAGSFKKDLKGDLVNAGGMVLQGWELDVDGQQAPGGIKQINLSKFTNTDPMPTSKATVGVNLDAKTLVKSSDAYKPDDPSTYHFETTIKVFDSLGKSHNVQLQFLKSTETKNTDTPPSVTTWEWHAVTDEGDGMKAIDKETGRVKEKPGEVDYESGKLKFNAQGRLISEGSTPLTFKFAGAKDQEILFDFGDAIDLDGAGKATGKSVDSTNDFSKKTLALLYDTGKAVLDKTTTGRNGSIQISSDFSTLRLEQDGFASGFLDKLSVNTDGDISGSYTNGQTKKLFQVALVDFNNEVALEQTGSNLYKETVASGLPRVGVPKSSRLGSVVSQSLEQSNVDMSTEFVRMIATQRGFQANSRIVSVTDGMLEELISLKR